MPSNSGESLNPNARGVIGVVTLADIRFGLAVVVISRNGRQHDPLVIKSMPFWRSVPTGQPRQYVKALYVRVRRDGYKFDTSVPLAAIGVCPDTQGLWSHIYAVRASQYQGYRHR